MLLLGRSTAQWMGLLTAFSGMLYVVVPTLFPGINAQQLNIVLGALVIFFGSFTAFLANSSLTPVADPRLEIGTTVNAGLHNEAVVAKKVATTVEQPAPAETQTIVQPQV